MHNSWTKAIDLEQWADKLEARPVLPALVRRLVWATTNGKRVFSFPAGEGIQRPSWDGRLAVEQGCAWAPSGDSMWEISTGTSPAAKAQENYTKRKAATPAAEAAGLTFVFVTPRKWTDKLDWVKDRKAEGHWKDVKVIDSDDFEHWLETAPAVDAWFARAMGKVPAGVVDLSHRWQLVSELTTPPLPPAAFLAGRQPARDELATNLAEAAREIPVAASSEHELVDFAAAAFGSLGEDDALAARLVLIETTEAWDKMSATTGSLVLLPAPGLAVSRIHVAKAVKAGHHVITRRPYSSQAETGVIRLPRAWRHELNEALIKAGFTEERASRFSGECGGHLSVLQRLAVPNSGTAVPLWAQDPDGAKLVPFVLFGAWDDAKEADRAVVAQFTGGDYDQALALASGWLVKPESPFHRSRTGWYLASREDAWIHLAPRLSRAQLDDFAKRAVAILSEDDPQFELDPEQRIFASLHGKLHRHSGKLREGLAETLALLGAELVPLPAVPTGAGQGYARKVVRELLAGNLSTHRWFTLSPLLKLLAEAAPEEFLEAVERDLSANQPSIIGLFAGDIGGVFGTGSRHYNLMWALTTLAWDPGYLARTALVLSHLAALDPGGKTSPRPADSLHDVFRPWFPQTGATPAQRFEVIDLLIERAPEQGWALLMDILPMGHDHASGTYPPRWREWPGAKKPRVTRRERREQWGWTGERLVRLALQAPARLLALVGKVDHLLDPEFTKLTTHLLGLDLKSLPPAERKGLWNALHDLVRRHEFFNTAEWRMADERLAILRTVESHLRPEHPTERGRWLFAQHHLYMGTHKETSHDQQEAIALEQRKALLSEIHAVGGLAAIADFAMSLAYPGLVGDVLARTALCPDPDVVLPKYLEGPEPNGPIFGRAYAAVLFNQRDWVWIDSLDLRKWTSPAATQLLLVLSFAPRTWDLAKTLGPEVEKAYWSQVWPFPRGLTSEQAAIGLERLLEHGRPLVAVDYLTLVYHNKLSVPANLLARALEESVPALNAAAASDQHATDVIYDLESVLGYLQDAPDGDAPTVARLEWTYLPLMRDGSATPKFLQNELARDPSFFSQCVGLVWPPDAPPAEPPERSESDEAKADLARNLLRSWSTHPSLLVAGRPDEATLRSWIETVRRLCAETGRVAAGDHAIGELLASSPTEADGSWPCIAVRNVLETIPGDIALEAFGVAIFNGRGATSRGMRDGGEQERILAKQYQGYADTCQMRWPRLAAALRRLARGYESDARYMDDEADSRA